MAAGACGGQMLDHPEILDRENLIAILCNRSIPLNEVKELDKEDLVSLFYKFVAPLPQRLHQLRRGKRKPPQTIERTQVNANINSIQERKRVREEQNCAGKVKVPKSDLEHVLINNGPSKVNVKNQETDLASNINLKSPITNQEVKTKPVKLKRKFMNLNISTPPGNPSSDTSNEEIEKINCEKKRDREPEVSTDSGSHSTDEELKQTKKKFKKIVISWP